MNAPRHREIACALIIDTCGRFLLQQRDDIPGIVCPGMVGLFGGHREGDETFLQCVVREVHEEISYFVAPERFDHLASYSGTDADAQGGTVRGEFFVARDVPADALRVRHQRSLDRTGGLNKGEFLAHRNVHRSEDETANPTIEGTG